MPVAFRGIEARGTSSALDDVDGDHSVGFEHRRAERSRRCVQPRPVHTNVGRLHRDDWRCAESSVRRRVARRRSLRPRTERLTFEVILRETTNTIDFVYESMTGALTSTVAIENLDGTSAQRGCAAGTDGGRACQPTAMSRVRFTPIA